MNMLFVSKVYAQTELESPIKYGSIFEVIGAFVPVIVTVIGIALVGYLLFGAFLWLTSAGAPDKLASAQKTIVNAVIGFVLFAVMFGVFLFLSSILGIDWEAIVGGV